MEKEKIIRKSIQGKGEVDYDYKHDILFFKTKDRQYSKSIELLDNIVIDVDKSGFLVGIQFNGNYAVFYDYSKNEALRLMLDIQPNKIEIVTFYLPDKTQVPRL